MRVTRMELVEVEAGRHTWGALRCGFTDRRVSAHIFRHTFAVHYLMLGGDPFTLQQLLGHEDMETIRNYMHLNDTTSRHRNVASVRAIMCQPAFRLCARRADCGEAAAQAAS